MVSFKSTPFLPAQIVDGQGRQRIDYPSIARLAFPLFLDCSLQMVVSLTDAWFIGRISTIATAAIGAINFPITVLIMLFACLGTAVQTLIAQTYGSGDKLRAGQIVCTGLWAALLSIPIFGLIATAGSLLWAPFQLSSSIQQLALSYWFPRLLGGSVTVASWSLLGFFNAIGQPQIALLSNLLVALVNAGLNELLMFQFDLGMAGAAWASTASLTLAFILQLVLFSRQSIRQKYGFQTGWKLNRRLLQRLITLGIPLGLFFTSDLAGLACFQLMQVQMGVVPGAVTQIVITLLAISYLPTYGLAQAGMILVGQSVGAKNKLWAGRLGNAVIRLAVIYMGFVGIILAGIGTGAVSLFLNPTDVYASEVLAVGSRLLWLTAGYQVFHALAIASSFCLQGTGDVKVPTLLSISICWLGFVPLVYILSFPCAAAWLPGLPQLDLGLWGGWTAYFLYILTLGLVMFRRWQSGNWRSVSPLS